MGVVGVGRNGYVRCSKQEGLFTYLHSPNPSAAFRPTAREFEYMTHYLLTTVGLEPTIFGSEGRRLFH